VTDYKVWFAEPCGSPVPGQGFRHVIFSTRYWLERKKKHILLDFLMFPKIYFWNNVKMQDF